MPTEVFEDTQDIAIGLLEAEAPSSSSVSSYPLPRLSITGREEMRTFRTLILENEYLRVTVLPDLGGRISSLFDKRTKTEILEAPNALRPVAGGPRGATLPFGIELTLTDEDRLDALGPLTFAAAPADEEESPAELWLSDSVNGKGLSFHLHYSLASDRAELEIEFKVFNRMLDRASYNASLRAQMGHGSLRRSGMGFTFYNEARDAGFWLEPIECVLDGGSHNGASVTVARFEKEKYLAPRQLDVFKVRLVPVSGLGCLHQANAELSGSLREDGIRVQATKTRLGHKLLLLTESGGTLEAPVDLYPDRLLHIPASDLPEKATAFVIRDTTKFELLRVEPDSMNPLIADATVGALYGKSNGHYPTRQSSEEELRRFSFEVEHRHAAFVLLGYKALAEKEYAKAAQLLEQALLYNADDHLTWCAKAVAHRLQEGPGDERPELLNAHYIAPMEPALRAEAFLSLSQEIGNEPSPLLAQFEEQPECFVEVASLLVEMGLNDQATRWIDEALRHTDLAMLRYLQAFCFLRSSRMHVEAAEFVAAAGRVGFTPPYPWREIEWEALRAVSERFPNDLVLQQFVALRS